MTDYEVGEGLFMKPTLLNWFWIVLHKFNFGYVVVLVVQEFT